MKKKKAEATAQPIPSEKLKDFRIRELELQNLQSSIKQMLADVNADFDRLCNSHGVNKDHWNFDLRSGTMTRKAGKAKKDPAYRGPRAAEPSAADPPTTN